jgi:hypothetical protein
MSPYSNARGNVIAAALLMACLVLSGCQSPTARGAAVGAAAGATSGLFTGDVGRGAAVGAASGAAAGFVSGLF